MLVSRPLFFYTSLGYVLLASNFSLVSPSLSNSPAFKWITSLVNHVAGFALLQVVVPLLIDYLIVLQVSNFKSPLNHLEKALLALSTYCLSKNWFKLTFSAMFLPLYGVFTNETLMPIFKYVPMAVSFLQYAFVTFALIIISALGTSR